MNFNLTKIRPKGFHPSDSFNEVIESLSWSLSELGNGVIQTENTFSQSQSTNIIFGCELLPPGTAIPKGSIIYNLEQPSHPNFQQVGQLAFDSDCRIWDFSSGNVEQWKSKGIDSRHVPIGYTPNLTRIPKPKEQPIDVMFYGWLTPRRVKILDDLKVAGLKVIYVQNCYGGARDYLISQSKVVLNVHHDGRDMFEIVRVSYLWANRKCVITEKSSDEGIGYHYENLVEACKMGLNQEDWKYAMEYEGFNRISNRDYTAIVSQAFREESLDEVKKRVNEDNRHLLSEAGKIFTNHTIQSRYERGCHEGDMKDFLPWLRENARGNILEIGVRDGASTSALLLGVEKNGGYLTSLDIVDCSSLWNHPQWKFMNIDSKDVGMNQPNVYDMALIDGDHSREGYLTDLKNCFHWVKPGGLILSHDIQPSRTKEKDGGDFPSIAVREEYFRFCIEKGLTHFELPGENGMGVMVVKK